MTFRRLALKNVQGNWHQYIAYFLSSTFSVMIFFVFAAFIYHPGVVNGHIDAASKIRSGLVDCEYLIIIFSFFFVLYSNSAFLKSRKKEFGLLSLFGMTHRQIRRLVFYENTVIALAAIIAGIAFGTLFSKLFFMALSELLDVTNPIPFAIVTKAIIITAAGFFVLFQVITLFTLSRVGRSQIIDLLKAARKPKKVPVFSPWLIALSIVCLLAGYGLALITTRLTFILLTLPILFLVVVGTYFLFTQSSIALFRKLQKTHALYYKRTNMLTVSQMVFKLKDNARVLFMVSILSAVILTASGTFYIYYQSGQQQLLDYFPQTFSIEEEGLNKHDLIQPNKVKEILNNDGVSVNYQLEMVNIPITYHNGQLNEDSEAVLIAQRDYNSQAARMKGIEPINVNEGHAMYIYPFSGDFNESIQEGDVISASAGDLPLSLKLEGQRNKTIVNLIGMELFVLNDAQFDQVAAKLPDHDKSVYYGYELNDWESLNATVKKIHDQIPQKLRGGFHERVSQYLDGKQLSALTLFIGIFISFLFFIASGSMIYFKLFTELQEDQAQYKSLRRIGMTIKELRKITSLQIGIIFFVPFAVGVIHASFAYVILGNVMAVSVWQYGMVVIGIVFLMQLIYFLLTRRAYMNKITSIQ
ncbi:ABC transporter permease [Paenibacillus sepulcri]|uniref:ABC transporter permease n=1 Tax=Paenibacillus sepulcri TaxID=359917 RepID=A0ABS7C4C5_9BACL|nr:ABC transporter permease [Paenibacillus sepulcri]